MPHLSGAGGPLCKAFLRRSAIQYCLHVSVNPESRKRFPKVELIKIQARWLDRVMAKSYCRFFVMNTEDVCAKNYRYLSLVLMST